MNFLFLPFGLLIFISACTTNEITQKDNVVDEYNSKLSRYSDLAEQHYNLGLAINENSDNSTLQQEMVSLYLDWTSANSDELSNFKSFIEANYEYLDDNGKNPVLFRDSVKILLNEINVNEANFLRCGDIRSRYQICRAEITR